MDSELLDELQTTITTFIDGVDQLELRSVLSGPYDQLNAIVSLFAGAGGTDAQDWTQMMLRMYTRWFESMNYSLSIVDQTLGDEAGIKSVTMIVSGDLAYGHLKTESGVHRLVRISPFNANDKRQTSFAAVDIVPQIESDSSDIDIDPKDLRVDTYRASGAGGQHVNKTDSAVRITHLPTQLVAQSQVSRSQTENRQIALDILKSRLLRLMISQHKSRVEEIRGESMENAWGSQIRSYVLHPYSMVKDHRTLVETADVKGVLDGHLSPFVRAALLSRGSS